MDTLNRSVNKAQDLSTNATLIRMLRLILYYPALKPNMLISTTSHIPNKCKILNQDTFEIMDIQANFPGMYIG